MIREKSVLPTANNPYNEIGKDPCVFSDFILDFYWFDSTD